MTLRAHPVGAKIFVAACAVAAVSLTAVPRATSGAEPAWAVVDGDAGRGVRLIRTLGCAACHTIPGVAGARGNVGPPLSRFGDRVFIAGMLPNTPPNLVRWIRDPQGVVPGNAMPDMKVSDTDARDIAAYLYTLR